MDPALFHWHYPAGRHRSGSAVTVWGHGFHSSLTLWDPGCTGAVIRRLTPTSKVLINTWMSSGGTKAVRDLYADYIQFEGHVIFKSQHVPTEIMLFRHIYFLTTHMSVMCRTSWHTVSLSIHTAAVILVWYVETEWQYNSIAYLQFIYFQCPWSFYK